MTGEQSDLYAIPYLNIILFFCIWHCIDITYETILESFKE